jgi:hypothetical protein
MIEMIIENNNCTDDDGNDGNDGNDDDDDG